MYVNLSPSIHVSQSILFFLYQSIFSVSFFVYIYICVCVCVCVCVCERERLFFPLIICPNKKRIKSLVPVYY